MSSRFSTMQILSPSFSLSLFLSHPFRISSGLSPQKLSQQELPPFSLYMRPSFVRAETCSIFNTHVQRICARTHIHIYISVRLYIYIYIYIFIYTYNIIKNSIFLLVLARRKQIRGGAPHRKAVRSFAKLYNRSCSEAGTPWAKTVKIREMLSKRC